MAKNYFDRYVWLIDTINRHGHISKKEIDGLWYRSPLNEKRDKELAERTFHNHREAILDTFGIEIKCDRSLGYYISNSDDLEADGIRQWLLESLSMNNLLSETKGMRDRILFEKTPSSQKWLPVIVDAMRDGKVIELTYQSFRRDEPHSFKAKPYCLKLFKQRWYILAKSKREQIEGLWVYALDERMLDVVRTNQHFKLPAKFDAEEFFANYFGTIVGTEWKPREVIIRVANTQVKYFDTLPLHSSQRKVPEESNDQFTVYRYHLATTYDFKQELLRYGPDVTVLSPIDFREEVMEDVRNMVANYGLG